MVFGGIARVFGYITAEEKTAGNQRTITVKGIPANTIINDLSNYLKDNRLKQEMFLYVRKNDFTFYSFFALEIKNILERIKETEGKTYQHRRIADKIIASLLESTWLKYAFVELPKPLLDLRGVNNFKFSPLSHQAEALKQYSQNVPKMGLKGYLLAAGPGTGKTFIDLYIANCLPKKVAEYKIIISPRNAAELVWVDDGMYKAFKKQPKFWVSTMKGPPPSPSKNGPEYYIFHYEALDRAQTLVKELKRSRKSYFVIIDESHNFNTPTSIRTNRLIDICQNGNGPYSVWASGSPIKAIGLESVPLLKSIDPLFTQEVEKRFLKMFKKDSKEVTDIVARRLDMISFKVSAKSVKEIPPVTHQRVMVKIPNPKPFLASTVRADLLADMQRRMVSYKRDMLGYEKIFYGCLNEYARKITDFEEEKRYRVYRQYIERAKKTREGGAPDVEALAYARDFEKNYIVPKLSPLSAREFKRVRSVVKVLKLKVQGEALGNVYSKRKAECAYQLARHCNLPKIINNGLGKTLIFSTYSQTLSKIVDYTKSQGFKTLQVYGPTAKKVREIVGNANNPKPGTFFGDKDLNPLVASYAALSTAVPVFVANQVVMCDQPPRQYLYDQTVARAARKGQEHPVFTFELVLDTGNEPNISTRGVDIIDWSRQQVTMLLGKEFGGPDENDFLISNYAGDDVKNTSNIDVKRPSKGWFNFLSWVGF